MKVVDFDLAKQLAGEDVGSTSYCGTDGWMAPEVEAVKAAQEELEARNAEADDDEEGQCL